MKKLLCALLAVVAVGCFAGCVDHDDGKCDECGTSGGLLNPVVQNEEGDKELCAKCWAEELGEDWEDVLLGD